MPVDPNKKAIMKGKKQRWNKNKKKSWKTKIDISDINEGLEQKRFEEKTGVIEKKDEDLFVIETDVPSKPQTKMAKARSKVLHVNKVLGPPVVEKKLRVVKQKPIRVKKRKASVTAAVSTEGEIACLSGVDLWAESSEQVADKLFKVKDVVKHTQEVIGKRLRPEHMKKEPKAVCSKAVITAHPGASYNPRQEDHNELLSLEHQREVSKLEKEKKIERAIYVDPKEFVTPEEAEKELMEGLCNKEEESEVEEEGPGDETYSTVTVAKTRKRRRKEQMIKDEARQRAELKARRVRENDVFRTKNLYKEIKMAEVISQEMQKINKSIKEKTQPQLSYMKFEEPDQDLKLSDEVGGSLRNLKPEGDVMFDRYKSFQRRCIVEPRKKFKPAKRDSKVKYQEKRCFREVTLDKK